MAALPPVGVRRRRRRLAVSLSLFQGKDPSTPLRSAQDDKSQVWRIGLGLGAGLCPFWFCRFTAKPPPPEGAALRWVQVRGREVPRLYDVRPGVARETGAALGTGGGTARPRSLLSLRGAQRRGNPFSPWASWICSVPVTGLAAGSTDCHTSVATLVRNDSPGVERRGPGFLLLVIGLMPGRPGSALTGTLYGSFLLSAESGGCALAAVIAFVLGVCVTLLVIMTIGWRKAKKLFAAQLRCAAKQPCCFALCSLQ